MAAVPELDGLLRELDGALASLEGIINSITNFNQEDRDSKLNKAIICLNSVRTTKEAIQLEARNIPPTSIPSLQAAMKPRLAKFKQLVDLYEYKKTEIDRDILETEAETGGLSSGIGTGKNGVETLTAQGDQLQDQTDAAITNMGYLVTDAQQIAEATDAKLDVQTAQMGRVQGRLGEVQSNTKRAGQTVANMARNAASDLCIQILCGGIIICTISIIVLVSI